MPPIVVPLSKLELPVDIIIKYSNYTNKYALSKQEKIGYRLMYRLPGITDM